MSDLKDRLESLGLWQYYEVFVAEGFDTWETILDITESDLNSLNVKLGHRRKLQRAIAETRGVSQDHALSVTRQPNVTGPISYKSDDSGPESKIIRKSDSISSTAGPVTTKRKYRRHPKADENAPERPPSAYVIFSNQIREELKGQELSFTEIAKHVGERWQILSPEAREVCERQANAAKERYHAQMAEYKKTPQFAEYQAYLKDFKAKHGPVTGEGKRSKLETETSTSTRSSSHDNPDRSVHRRRISAGLPEGSVLARERSGSSPPHPSLTRTPGYSGVSKPTSPAAFSYSGINSPKLSGHFSPVSASPRSASATKEGFHDILPPASLTSAESRGSYGEGAPPTFPPFLSHQSTSSATSSSAGNLSLYQSFKDLPQRRPRRESSAMPQLTHEETTLSSESLQTGPHYQGSLLPVLDASKSQRVLPQPIPTPGAVLSPLDTMPTSSGTNSAPQVPEYRQASSLAALLRAGELARDADLQGDEHERQS